MPAKRRKARDEKASPDLTPMIDVTFQLLIFFILCTRFRQDERNQRVELPLKEGMKDKPSFPKEQLTVYCQWDAQRQSNSYVVGIDARGRRPVEGSFARLSDLVIFPSDGAENVQRKKALYKQIFGNLKSTIEQYSKRSGANVEKVEIAFAKDPTLGAKSGTAPWLFVSLAIDATAGLNKERESRHEKPYEVTFKFVDALGAYTH